MDLGKSSLATTITTIETACEVIAATVGFRTTTRREWAMLATIHRKRLQSPSLKRY
jgi:hypothetical protein